MFKGHRIVYKRPKRRFTRTPRPLHACDDCGKPTRLPFSPNKGLPVYCKACFARRAARRHTDRTAA
ncbi:MAG: DNA-directed RNA polymerase [Candidatus Aenigmarchaeota archaeon]|nr:DNA-directed RNA polymerase [Candidatus Aenigmarchaeota archaeon]